MEKTTPKSQSYARRFGGYFLGRLVPPQRSGLTDIEIAVDRENAIIDTRQGAMLHANLFRETKENAEFLAEFRDVFETKLAERDTMSERFALFAHPVFAPFVNTLDLGETKLPGSHDEVAALKEEYQGLLDMLTAAGTPQQELTRAQAKPTIHFRPHREEGYIPGDRNRKLLRIEDDERVITVAKRMTFLVPSSALQELRISAHGGLNRNQVRVLEKLIDAQDTEKIIPVRTVYYATSKPLDKSDEE